jgi:UPF0271 protein
MVERAEIDLCADVGESFGHWRYPQTEAVVRELTTAHIACGWHAGDPSVMKETVRWCRESGTAVAAHVGFPDLQGFGRRMMELSIDEAYDAIVYQVGALKAFTDLEGLSLHAATPHGQFGEWALVSTERSEAMLAAFRDVLGDVAMHMPPLPDAPFNATARKMGVQIIDTFYPGLAYNDQGIYELARDFGDSGLVQRTLDLMAYWLDTGKVETLSGGEVEVPGRAITFHGDVESAPEILAGMRRLCAERDIVVRSAIL